MSGIPNNDSVSTKNMDEAAKATSTKGALFFGLDSENLPRLFDPEQLLRSVQGIAYPDTIPDGDRFLGETWAVDTDSLPNEDASLGTSFPGFDNLKVPRLIAGRLVSNPRFVWDDGAWNLQRELVNEPSLVGVAKQTDLDVVAAEISGNTSYLGATDDLSLYTTNYTQNYSLLLFNKTSTVNGKPTKLELNCNQAGLLDIIIWRLVSGTNHKAIAKISVTAVVGINIFSAAALFAGIDILIGDKIGFTSPAGGALLKFKTVTSGSRSNTDNTIAVNDELSFATVSNVEFAVRLSIISEESGLLKKVSVLEATSLRLAEVTIEATANLAKQSCRIDNMYINTGTGAKVISAAALGWTTYRIPLPATDSAGAAVTKIAFGNFTITTGGNIAFYGEGEDPTLAGTVNIIGAGSAYLVGDLPKILTIPTGAKFLYITVKKPTNVDADFANIIINTGAVLLSTYIAAEVVTKIRGYGLKTPAVATPVVIANADRLEYTSNRKAIISFIFDDINTSDALVYNIFKEFGFRPNFALKTNQLTDANKLQYLSYWKDGCSILSHSVTHPIMATAANITAANLNTEMVNSKKAINDIGIICSGWVTPNSVLSPSFFNILDRIYGYAFVVDPDAATGWNQLIAPNRMSRYYLEGTDIAGNSLAAVTARINTAIANKELLTFYAHKLPSATLDSSGNSWLTEQKLRDVLAYLKGKSDNFECMVLNSDDAVKTYYQQTYAEKFS